MKKYEDLSYNDLKDSLISRAIKYSLKLLSTAVLLVILIQLVSYTFLIFSNLELEFVLTGTVSLIYSSLLRSKVLDSLFISITSFYMS